MGSGRAVHYAVVVDVGGVEGGEEDGGGDPSRPFLLGWTSSRTSAGRRRSKTLPPLAKTKDTQVWERLHMFDDNGGNPKSSSSTGGELHMRLINNMHGRCRILGRGLINYGSLILAFFSSL